MSYERAIAEQFEAFKRRYREPKAQLRLVANVYSIENSRIGPWVILGEYSALMALKSLNTGYSRGFDDGWGERSDAYRTDEEAVWGCDRVPA